MNLRTRIAAVGLAAITGAAGLATVAATSNAAADASAAESVATANLAADVFEIDGAHSGVIFKVRHFAHANFYGRFDTVKGSFSWDGDTPTNSTVEIEIPIDSVNTGIEGRDDHLRKADFFNARQYPTATFKSTGMSSTGKDNIWNLEGDLTMHGTTKSITAELELISAGKSPQGATVAGFEARFTIKRGDYGIMGYLAEDGSDNGGIGNTVELTVFVEGKKK